MQRQHVPSRATGAFLQTQDDQPLAEVLKRVGPTEFTGYEGITGSGNVVALIVDGAEVESISTPQRAMLVLDSTPFYAESGGQIGDQGDISGAVGVFHVQDTRRPGKGLIVNYGEMLEG